MIPSLQCPCWGLARKAVGPARGCWGRKAPALQESLAWLWGGVGCIRGAPKAVEICFVVSAPPLGTDPPFFSGCWSPCSVALTMEEASGGLCWRSSGCWSPCSVALSTEEARGTLLEELWLLECVTLDQGNISRHCPAPSQTLSTAHSQPWQSSLRV